MVSVCKIFQLSEQFFQAHRRLLFILLYAAANAMPALASFILVLIYTAALPVSEFGRLNVLTATVAFLAIFIELGMPSAILREYCDRYRDAKAMQYLANAISGYRWVSALVLPLLVAVVFWLWPLPVQALWRTMAMISVLVLIAYFERLAETYGSVARAIEAPSHLLIGRTVTAISTIVAAILLVAILHAGVFGALMSRMTGAVAANVVYRLRMARRENIKGGRFCWDQMRTVLKIGLPLMPNRFAMWTQQQGLKPVLAQFVPLKGIAHYSLAASIAFMPLMATSIIDMALSPVYFKRRVDAGVQFEERIRRLATVMMAGVFLVFAALIMFTPEIVVGIGGAKYAPAVPACAFLFCAAYIRALSPFLNRQILYSRKTWLLPMVTVPSAAVAIVTAAVACRWLGFMAGAFAIVLSEVVMIFGLAMVIRRIERLQLPMVRLVFFVAALLGLATISGSVLLYENVVLVASAKAGIVAAVGAAVYLIWLRPNQAFIRELMKGGPAAR